MLRSNKKILGVIGGMGPYATLKFFEKFIKYNKKAIKDQDHYPLYILNDPEILDRTDSIIKGENLDKICKRLGENAIKLENMGCDYLVMPCNTAHYFYDKIQKNVEIPIISLIDETLYDIREQGKKSFGLLSTMGTVFANVYDKSAYDLKLDVYIPNLNQQDRLSDIIYDIKGNTITEDFVVKKRKELLKICDEMYGETGVDTFVLGCTELCILGKMSRYNFIDPMDMVIKKFYSINKE